MDLTGCGVTYIDQYCFNYDYALKDVKPFLPDSVTYCGQSCFTDTGVTNFLRLAHFKAETLPSFIRNSSVCGLDLTGSQVSNICNSCFQGVPLRRVILPESLMSIEAEAFRSVYHAKGLFFRGPPPNMALRTFILNASMAGAYVLPKGKHAPAWKEYIATDPRLVSTLTEAERKAFSIADVKPPTQKLNMNKDNGEVKPQYLCWWWPRPRGLMISVR